MNVLDRIPPKADHRLPYGNDPLQFGDLRLPAAAKAGSPAPLLVMIHGGWWKAQYDLEYCGFLCEAFRKLGVATWSLEYLRVGNAGGGWPGTMQDVGAGFDFVTKLAQAYPVDVHRVVAAGHSAGGHLAFWLAGRHHIAHDSPLHEPQPTVGLRGVVGLAGAVDLRLVIDLAGVFEFAEGKAATESLLGGLPKQVEDRYRAANPGDLLPLGVPQVLVQGSEDGQIAPTLPERYAANARRQGDPVTVRMIEGADHFDVVDPESKAWPVVRDAVMEQLKTRG